MLKFSPIETEMRVDAVVGVAAFDRVRAPFAMTMMMTIMATMRGEYG